jgi:myo-inositol-1(or 4)-monophosphatase
MRSDAVRSTETKSSPTDPVTAGDRAAEEIIVDGILAARPDDGIVGEEGAQRQGTSGIDWLIDPIDGTVNYLYDIPAYSVSVAARFAAADDLGHPILAGVVYNPVSDELFRATRSGGASLNGQTISVTDADELASSLVGTGFAYSAARRRAQAQVLLDVLGSVRDIRRAGSAALDLCSVACGRLDAYYEVGLNSWDYGAGWLIATEAGAMVSDLRGGPPSSTFTLAATSKVHDQLAHVLRGLDADQLPD